MCQITILDVPLSNRYLAKIAVEEVRSDRHNLVAPVTTKEVQKVLVGKPFEEVVRYVSEI